MLSASFAQIDLFVFLLTSVPFFVTQTDRINQNLISYLLRPSIQLDMCRNTPSSSFPHHTHGWLPRGRLFSTRCIRNYFTSVWPHRVFDQNVWKRLWSAYGENREEINNLFAPPWLTSLQNHSNISNTFYHRIFLNTVNLNWNTWKESVINLKQ